MRLALRLFRYLKNKERATMAAHTLIVRDLHFALHSFTFLWVVWLNDSPLKENRVSGSKSKKGLLAY